MRASSPAGSAIRRRRLHRSERRSLSDGRRHGAVAPSTSYSAMTAMISVASSSALDSAGEGFSVQFKTRARSEVIARVPASRPLKRVQRTLVMRRFTARYCSPSTSSSGSNVLPPSVVPSSAPALASVTESDVTSSRPPDIASPGVVLIRSPPADGLPASPQRAAAAILLAAMLLPAVQHRNSTTVTGQRVGRTSQLRAEPFRQSLKDSFQSPYPLSSVMYRSLPVTSTTSPTLEMP